MLRIHCGLGTALCFTVYLLSLKPAFEADVLKKILLMKTLVQRVRHLAPNQRRSDQVRIWSKLACLHNWRSSHHDVQLCLPKPLVLPIMGSMATIRHEEKKTQSPRAALSKDCEKSLISSTRSSLLGPSGGI